MSLTRGGEFIIEDCWLGGSFRSLIDAEPVSNSVFGDLTAPVDGIYVLDCTIGSHVLGILALHAGSRNVLMRNCDGVEIVSSGVIIADHVIIENCNETSSDVPAYAFQFAGLAHDDENNNVGQDWGGHDFIVRNNVKKVSVSGCNIHAGCVRYSITGNNFGGKAQATFAGDLIPAVSSDFVSFTLPIPVHDLRVLG
jgi:hypothetical protein